LSPTNVSASSRTLKTSPSGWVKRTKTRIHTESHSHDQVAERATDKTGKIQTGEAREPFPNGATGYHMVDVQSTN
jgi:hypothetical protein